MKEEFHLIKQYEERGSEIVSLLGRIAQLESEQARLASALREAKAGLDQSLRQWAAYAGDQRQDDLIDGDDMEAILFRKYKDTLSKIDEVLGK